MAELFTWVVIFLFGLQFLLLISLVVWKQRTLNRVKGHLEIANKYRPALDAFIKGQSTTLPALDKKQLTPAIAEMVLDEYSSHNLTVAEQENLSAVAEKYLALHYRKALKKGTWAERMNALYFIEDFKIHSLREDCFGHFKSLTKQDEEYRQTLRTCATLQEYRLFREESVLNEVTSGLMKELLFRMDEDLLQKVLRELQQNEKLPENVLRGLLVFSGEHKIEAAFPFVEQKLQDERKEVRLKAMQSLSLYGKVSDPEKIRPFFESGAWEERMYAAKLTGACRLNGLKDHLLNTLADSNWWVRFSSAESLSSGPDGELLLQDAAVNHQDPYARDIARHVLTQKGRNTS